MRRDAFLTSALDADEWSASRPGRFNPGEGGPCTEIVKLIIYWY
jgi:hypothetical protein